MTGSFGVVPQPRRMRPVRRRRRPSWPLIVLAVVLALALFGGGVALAVHKHNEDEHQEMVRIVHSKEAKKVFDKEMKINDPNAFTPKGIIHSYEIRDKAIARNPMFGIDVTLYINGDDDLYISTTLNKNNTVSSEGRQSLTGGGMVLSTKLSDLLDAKETTQNGANANNVPSQFEQEW